MSKTRTANNLEQLCTMFKALSNPQRLRMFLKLAECADPAACEPTGEGVRRCVGDLSEDSGVTASTVSHHLKELRQSGLMRVERRGQKIECWISDEALQLLAAFFDRTIEMRARTPARAGSKGRK